MNADEGVVTIIVPAYKGAGELRACIESVYRHTTDTTVPTTLVVIDDASPEPEVTSFVDALGASPQPIPTVVLRNPENRGFVRSVNRGFELASGPTVVLNADTVVSASWLDRLHAAAEEIEGVATVTPLSNFGSICTLPPALSTAFDLDSDEPRIDECAAFVATRSPGLRPSVISGVGFCMYVTAEALRSCGPFDEDTFGLGYGEEVDFCLRATRLGFVHVAEDSTFVFHRGGTSFGSERAERMANAATIVHERYPFFGPSSRRDRAENPLAVSFAALELGLADRDPTRPHVLHILHSPPSALGGTEKHIAALTEALLPELDFSLLFPVDSGFVVQTCWNVGRDEPLEIEFLLPGGARRVTATEDVHAAAALDLALELFEIDAVHVHNLIGHSLAPLAALERFRGPVVCSVRDYYLACPNHSLLYRNRDDCGIPSDLSVCQRCLPETRNLSVGHLTEFRRIAAERLEAVDRFVFASQSAADYTLRVYDIPPEKIRIIPHGSLVRDARPRRADIDLIEHEPLRLAFVGLGWQKKGLDAVSRLAVELEHTSLEVHHFGPVKDPVAPQVLCHGPYDNEFLADLLVAAGIQVVLLPGRCAETFSHVLTEAIAAGIPVIGARYGALGERIREFGIGWTIDPEDDRSLADLVLALDAARWEVVDTTRNVLAAPLDTMASTAPHYASLYHDGSPRRDRTPMSPDLERLRSQLRALSAHNRHLHVQLDEARRRPAGASAPRPADGASFVVDASAISADTEADAWLAQLAGGADASPSLVRASDGAVFVLEAGTRRRVRSGLLAAALEEAIGPIAPIGDDSLATRPEGLAIDLLADESGAQHVVVGGRRLLVRGLPVAQAVTRADLARFADGGTIDVARANVPRRRADRPTARPPAHRRASRALRRLVRMLGGLSRRDP